MRTFKTALFAAAVSLATAATANAAEWTIDPAHTIAGFSVRHLMVSTVRGQFGNVTGIVSLDDADLVKSKVEVTIDATTIDTQVAKRDEHLRSPDFFDVAKFPTLTFKSTKIEKAGNGFAVTGDLTMHGVTRPITLAVDSLTPAIKNPWGQMVRGVSATGKLNRKDWGLGWNKVLEAGGVAVGEEITLQIDAELNEKK